MKRGDDLRFIRFESFERNDGKVRMDHYNKVYEGHVMSGKHHNALLEELFQKFNLDRPEDFRGHSLSMSDIVKLNDKLYYCDSIGWVEVVETHAGTLMKV